MDPDIMWIKLAQEAENWDEMVDRIEIYLKKNKEAKL